MHYKYTMLDFYSILFSVSKNLLKSDKYYIEKNKSIKNKTKEQKIIGIFFK